MGDVFPERIETDRLVQERLCHEAVGVRDYYDLWASADPAVYDHLSATPFETLAEAKAEIDAAEEHWADDDTAAYLVRVGADADEPDADADEPDAGALVGRTSLDCDWDRRVGDLGAMFAKRFWGRGYAGEAAGALTRLAFDRLDLGVVTADHRAGNDRSRRALEKFVDEHGGQCDGVRRDAPTPGEVETRRRYSVTRGEYRAATD